MTNTELVLDCLDTVELYLNKLKEANVSLRSGFLHLAEAKYALGPGSISEVQYPTHPFPAQKILGATEGGKLELLSASTDELGEKEDQDTEETTKVDPLTWFGALPHTSMRAAQTDFRQALYGYVQLAELSLQLKSKLAQTHVELWLLISVRLSYRDLCRMSQASLRLNYLGSNSWIWRRKCLMDFETELILAMILGDRSSDETQFSIEDASDLLQRNIVWKLTYAKLYIKHRRKELDDSTRRSSSHNSSSNNVETVDAIVPLPLRSFLKDQLFQERQMFLSTSPSNFFETVICRKCHGRSLGFSHHQRRHDLAADSFTTNTPVTTSPFAKLSLPQRLPCGCRRSQVKISNRDLFQQLSKLAIGSASPDPNSPVLAYGQIDNTSAGRLVSLGSYPGTAPIPIPSRKRTSSRSIHDPTLSMSPMGDYFDPSQNEALNWNPGSFEQLSFLGSGLSSATIVSPASFKNPHISNTYFLE